MARHLLCSGHFGRGAFLSPDDSGGRDQYHPIITAKDNVIQESSSSGGTIMETFECFPPGKAG